MAIMNSLHGLGLQHQEMMMWQSYAQQQAIQQQQSVNQLNNQHVGYQVYQQPKKSKSKLLLLTTGE